METMQEAMQSGAGAETPITMRQLARAGVHFGHQTKRWNPKMKPYIFGSRNGIHIIDLQHTVRLFNRAYNFIVNTIANGGTLLFVGTKKQAQEVIQQESMRAGQYFVTHRWLGGTLTNFRTVKGSIERLRTLEKMARRRHLRSPGQEGSPDAACASARSWRRRSAVSRTCRMCLGDLRHRRQKEHIAISEARKLEIPVIAIADTNCDPDVLDYVIPGNDDAIRAIKLFTGKIADACVVGGRIGRERAATQRHEPSDEGRGHGHGHRARARPRLSAAAARRRSQG